jgi:hypothetical protein
MNIMGIARKSLIDYFAAGFGGGDFKLRNIRKTRNEERV